MHFRPYSQGTPRIPGLEPGVTLSRNNVHSAKEMLPPEILQLIESEPSKLLFRKPLTSHLAKLILMLRSSTPIPSRWMVGVLRSIISLVRHSLSLIPQIHKPGKNWPGICGIAIWGKHSNSGLIRARSTPQAEFEHSNRGHMRIRFGMYRPNPTDNDPQCRRKAFI